MSICLKKKISAMILVLIMISSVFIPCLAVSAEENEVVILYTNDIHSYIDGGIKYSHIASLKKSYKNSLLVDAGDHVQGTAYGSMDKGETIVKLMNEAGYDLATLGNHEFDYGMEGCMKNIERAEYSYLSCNFHHEKDGVIGDTVLEPYKIYEMGGFKIAIIGITTPETFTKTTPTYFQNDKGEYIYGIIGGSDGKALYECVQSYIDEASLEADYVIALGHLGVDLSSVPWTSREVIQNTIGLDAFIDGHSHNTIAAENVKNKVGKDVLLTQTGEYLSNVGKITISENGIKAELLTAEDMEDIVPDENVQALEKNWENEINKKLGEVIGKSDVIFDNYDENGNRLVRKQSTNTADFSADALYYLFDEMGMDVDVAVMNGGGIRNTAITGDITYFDCKSIHTFGNVACLQTVTGQELLDALEWGSKDLDGIYESGSLLHTSGLTYKVDLSVKNTTQSDEKGVWIGGPTGQYRVYDVKIYNKKTNAWDDLELEKKYNLAGYNYTLRDLGGGFNMFENAVNVLDYVMEDYMVLANYVKAFENNTISAKNSPLLKKYPDFKIDYENTEGSQRLVVGERIDDIPSPSDSSAKVEFILLVLASFAILSVLVKRTVKR